MARGKKSKSRVVSRSRGSAPQRAASGAAQQPAAVAEPEPASADEAEPAAVAPDGSVTQPIFGGGSELLEDPAKGDRGEARARQDAEVEARLAKLRQVLDTSLEQRGPDHPGTLQARADIAMALWRAGRHDEAI